MPSACHFAGTEGEDSICKGRKKKSRALDGSSAQKVPALHATEIAGSSLPGLYKSRHLPHIDPDALHDCESESDSGGVAMGPAKKQQMLGQHAHNPPAIGKQATMKQTQKPLRQRLPGLKYMREVPEADKKGLSMKRLSRKTLPGRLRKKLAKEASGVHASQTLTTREAS